MKRLILVLICVFLASCSTSGIKAKQAPRLMQKEQAVAQDMFKSVGYIGAPLKNLTPEQQSSLAALLLVTRIAAQQEVLFGDQVTKFFWTEVEDICPTLKKGNLSRGGCFALTIDFASCMSSCRKEHPKGGSIGMGGKDWVSGSEYCDYQCDGKEGPVAACMLKEFEDTRTAIQDLDNRTWPPGPFPWPMDNPMKEPM